MTDHPITPPPELVQQLREQAPRYRDGGAGREHWLIERAFSEGYDHRGEVNEAQLQKARDEELEACSEWLDRIAYRQSLHIRGSHLRTARRPKPPSLKERLSKAIVEGDERQALKLLEELDDFLEHSQHHPPRTGGTSR